LVNLAAMKKAAFILLALLTLAGPVAFAEEPTPAESIPPENIGDPAVYGEYPKNYKSIVLNWLADKLADFASSQIVWDGPPKPSELSGKDGKRFVGYLVEFKVNARNQFGAYTGMQKHGALIRDGKVIKATGFIF
jgi:hypothetical protein